MSPQTECFVQRENSEIDCKRFKKKFKFIFLTKKSYERFEKMDNLQLRHA